MQYAPYVLLQDPGGRAPAPEPLRLAQAFVNTLDIENGVELLSDPPALRAVLMELGVGDLGPLTEADLRAALDVREALRALALANNGVPLAAHAAPAIERAGRAAHFTLEVDEHGRIGLVATAGGVDGAVGRVLSVVHEAMADGTWSRLKGCPRDVCHWLFYDRSRNASSKWCAMSVCGNRTNTKLYRARHAA
jgi:predicted RNA-binding Zn ribbon-like protein